MRYVEVYKGEGIDTKGIIENVVKRPPTNKGLGVDEMRKRIRVLDALDNKHGLNTEGWFAFEDADWQILKDCLKEAEFVVVHKDIIEIADRIDNAPTSIPASPIT